MNDLDAVFAASDALDRLKSVDVRVIDEEIAHRRDLRKLAFTVFGSALSNTQMFDVLHELTAPADRKDPAAAAARLAALADPFRHNETVLGSGHFYLIASDLYAGLAQRIAGIKQGTIKDDQEVRA